jgi:hypothetical protein
VNPGAWKLFVLWAALLCAFVQASGCSIMLPTMVGVSSLDSRSRFSSKEWKKLKPGRRITVCRRDGTIDVGRLLGFSPSTEDSVVVLAHEKLYYLSKEPDTTRIPVRDVRWIRTHLAYPGLVAFALGLAVDYKVFSYVLEAFRFQ